MKCKLSDNRLLPEDIWGLEAMDFLEHTEWVHSLWDALQERNRINRPLLLLYAPSAERTALRCLHTFARIGRSASPRMAVFFSTGHESPFLPFQPEQKAGLYLVHQASRFLDLQDFLLAGRMNPESTIILTASELETKTLKAYYMCHLERVRAEEPNYCEKRAAELIAKFASAGNGFDPHFDLALQILAETGIAGVALPIGLLAKHLHLDCAKVLDLLESARMHKFVRLTENLSPARSMVAFRGQWLAETIALQAKVGYYPRLCAMIESIDPAEYGHRYFLLSFLIALRSQGQFKEMLRLRAYYSQKIDDCFAHASTQERAVWGIVMKSTLSQTLKLIVSSAEKGIKSITSKKIHAGILILLSAYVFLGRNRKLPLWLRGQHKNQVQKTAERKDAHDLPSTLQKDVLG